jgi:hypothetical protein
MTESIGPLIQILEVLVWGSTEPAFRGGRGSALPRLGDDHVSTIISSRSRS